MTRISKHLKPGVDLAGHPVRGKKDLQLIDELRMKRYKTMLDSFSKHTLQELKAVYTAPRSSTDNKALQDAIYLKAKETHVDTEFEQLKELFSKIPHNDGTFVYPEAKAIAEIYFKREKEQNKSSNTANDNKGNGEQSEESGIQPASDSTNESTTSVEPNH